MSQSRPLSPAETRGMLTIAKARPEATRAVDIKNAFVLIESAIRHGDPSHLIPDCTREDAKNWAPR